MSCSSVTAALLGAAVLAVLHADAQALPQQYDSVASGSDAQSGGWDALGGLYALLAQHDALGGHALARKSVRSPSRRLRFGRRSDPDMPPQAPLDEMEELLSLRETRTPVRLRFGRRSAEHAVPHVFPQEEQEREVRAPSMRLRFGRRSDNNMFLLPYERKTNDSAMANPKIVHKQFNSPLGLYSQQNISETLSKHLQNLDNGSVGIDFNQPGTDKPANLANSAVLRMLEEEERSRRGYPKLDPTQVKAILDTMVHMDHRFDSCWPPERARMRSARSWDGQLNSTCNIYSEFLRVTKGQKKVVWPPLPETNGYHQSQPQQRSPAYNAPQSPQQQQQYQPQEIQIPVQHYHTQPSQPSQPSPQYQAQNYEQEPSYQSAACEGRRQEACGLSKLIPVGPGASPAPQYRGPASAGVPRQGPVSPRQQPQSNRWAPVAAPLSPQINGSQPSYPQQAYSPQPPFSPQYSQPEPVYQQRQFEPPATTITLRPQPPVHQQPAPVYASQPVTASYKGGVNMRGDNKWPPQSVREAVAAENDARRQLARGPACRPRKVKKDYASFFAQNALNNNYPGYRAPPGTQHYEELSGRTSY